MNSDLTPKEKAKALLTAALVYVWTVYLTFVMTDAGFFSPKAELTFVQLVIFWCLGRLMFSLGWILPMIALGYLICGKDLMTRPVPGKYRIIKFLNEHRWISLPVMVVVFTELALILIPATFDNFLR